MLSNQEKLLEFNRSIESELKEQLDHIDEDIENFRQSQMQTIEDEIYADCYKMIQTQVAKIKLNATIERSREVSKLKKKMLLKRDEYVKLVFDEVKERLLEYVRGDEYHEFLRAKLTEIKSRFTFEHPRLLVCHDGMAHREEFLRLLPGCVVEESPDITIGGFILEDEGKPFVINESMDNTLEEQKTWFYSNSGLRITQF